MLLFRPLLFVGRVVARFFGGLRRLGALHLKLATVLEQELIGGPETGLGTVLDHRARSGRTRQLLDLHPEEGDTGEEVHGGLEVLQPFLVRGGKVVLQHGNAKRAQQTRGKQGNKRWFCVELLGLLGTWSEPPPPPTDTGRRGRQVADSGHYYAHPVHGEIYSQRVVQLVEQLDKFVFLHGATITTTHTHNPGESR